VSSSQRRFGSQVRSPSQPFGGFWEIKKQKRIPFLKNEPERLLKTKDRGQKANRTEPKNEAEKLLKTRSCGKNEPKTNRKTKLPTR